MSYFRYPLKFTAITNYFSSNHKGLDFGWNNKYGGKNCSIYAIADSKVVEVGYNDETGYRVWLQTDDDSNRWLHRYIHLQKKPSLKVGQKVKKGAKIGNMGNTGYSFGEHLHFDLWKCPKGYTMKWTDRTKYAVDPTDYLYIHSGQVKSSESANKKGVKDVPKETYIAGTYKTTRAMNIRTGAGTSFRKKKVKELTADGRKNATSKNLNAYAQYKKGTIFTVTKVLKAKNGSIWGCSPSGWICLKGKIVKYCTKL